MAFTQITGGGAFTRRNIEDINDNFARIFALTTTGRAIYCDPASGATGVQDGSEDHPYTQLTDAFGAAATGKNDIIFLVGNGGTTASARLTSNLAWNKNAVHLFGIAAPSYNTRARVTTLSGTSAFAAFVTVTGTGCLFSNFAIFNDNAIAAQITWTEQGGRNFYNGIQFGGMGDGTSAHSTSSRIMVLGGSGASGENRFVDCTFGIDTSLTPGRDVANATIEFVGSSKRNVFQNCQIAGMGDGESAASAGSRSLKIGSSGSGENLFEDCVIGLDTVTRSAANASVEFAGATPSGLPPRRR